MSDFRVHNRFAHAGREWAVGEYNNRANGHNGFANAIHSLDGKESYGLIPTIEQNTVTDVKLTDPQHKEGKDIGTLDGELRNRFASALEWSAKKAGVKVEPEMLEAVREGRSLKAERETEADFTRLTRNVDHDLEAAYMLRDDLKAQVREAVEEGRIDDAKTAGAQLNAVKEDIQGYWNPHKERPNVERPLTPKEQEDVDLFRMVVESDVDREAAKLASQHFQKEAEQALERGDSEAAAEAGEKSKGYAERIRAEQQERGKGSGQSL